MPVTGVNAARVFDRPCAITRHAARLGLAGLVLASLGLAAPASAQQTSAPAVAADAAPAARNVLIVFDGSGSMWGRIDGDKLSKFHLARDAFKKVLSPPPANVKLGLMSFGHRRQADCSDVGVLTQIDGATPEHIAERISAPLDKLNPKGKGPVAAALREAAKILGKTSGPRSLILVHDGLDNCGLDACAIAGELKEASPGLQINVVGLGLDEEEAKTYQCLTSVTGGRHVDVRNAGEVGAAIEAVTKAAFAAADPKPAAAAAAQKALIAPLPKPVDLAVDGPPHLRLRALAAPGKPAASDRPLRWSVRAEDDKALKSVRHVSGQDVLIPVTAGSYVVAVEDGIVRAERTIAAPSKGHLLAEATLNAGYVRLAHAAAEGALLSVFDTKGQAATPSVLSGKPIAAIANPAPIIALPAGAYVVRQDSGNQRLERAVTVAAGSTVDADFSSGARIEVMLGQRIAADGKDGRSSRPVILSIEEDDPLSPRGRREIARSAAAEAVFTVPPGTYTLVASQGPLEVRERIAVTSGESVRRVLPLGASRLILAMRGPSGEALGTDGLPVWYRIERLDAAGTEPLHSFDTNAIVDVPPGRYRIVGHTTSTAVQGAADVDVGNGETRAVVLTPAAGVLVLRPGALLVGDVTWHITDGAGRRVWVTGTGDRRVALAPGDYTVRAAALGAETGRRVDIKTGQLSEVTLGN